MVDQLEIEWNILVGSSQISPLAALVLQSTNKIQGVVYGRACMIWAGWEEEEGLIGHIKALAPLPLLHI